MSYLMNIVLAAFGSYMVFMGAIICVKPSTFGQLMEWWLKHLSRAQLLIALILGGLLLWASPASRAPQFIQFLGLYTIIEGIYVFFSKKEQLNSMVEWWSQLSNSAYYVLGIITLSLGAVIFATI